MKILLVLMAVMLSLSAGAQEPDARQETPAETLDENPAVAPSPQTAAPAQQAAPAARAGSSEVVNLSATIVGNQEQPTVLYIVPWKAAEDTTILYLPLSSKAMEEIFGHVERVEHQRQVEFIDQLDNK